MTISRLGFMRARLEGSHMPHTYTRQGRTALADNPATATVDESEDAWAEQAFDAAAPAAVPEQPCRWMPTPLQGTIGGQRTGQYIATGAIGDRIVQNPVMLVPHTDPILPGDMVSNVVGVDPDTEQDVVLFEGPARVSNVIKAPVGDTGGAICKRVYLRSGLEVV